MLPARLLTVTEPAHDRPAGVVRDRGTSRL